MHPGALRRLDCLTGAVALSIALSLLLPSAAPARQRRSAEQSGEITTATSGESSSATPGEPGARGRRQAERRAARGGGCRVEMKVASSRLTAGESATITGTLTCPTAAEAAEQTVTIYQRTAGTPGFSVAGTATSADDGSYEFTTEALEIDSAFYASAVGARSRHRAAVKVAPLVTISGPPEDTPLLIAGRRAGADATASNTVTLSGTVSPDQAGARVLLQRESAGAEESWRRIGLGEVGADGRYSITHTFSSPGQATVRVLVRIRGLVTTASEPLSYEIAQRQNPRLTIHASAQPLFYGESVTLSGIAVDAAEQPVTLLARSRNGNFAALATVNTDADGNYVFPVQSPLQSTDYKVTDADTRSANLFEPVEPVLKAEVSSSSVQSGEPVTFSGTIAPDHTGRLIYLERQNASGIGFHVVEVATVSAGSIYAIEHTAFGAGTQVFRVEVPADEESPATTSEPFEIQVTPAAAASLPAEGSESGSAPPGES